MTTITRLKQLKDWLDGKLQDERVQRKPVELTPTPPTTQMMQQPPVLLALSEHMPDRFKSFKEKIIPSLLEHGYECFLSCDTNDFIEHQKWCQDHCEGYVLPYCDVWMVSTVYPRAFANKADAAMFKLTFGATNIIV